MVVLAIRDEASQFCTCGRYIKDGAFLQPTLVLLIWFPPSLAPPLSPPLSDNPVRWLQVGFALDLRPGPK